MVVDASVLAAILLDESDADDLYDRLTKVRDPVTHPVSIYETVLAVARETGRYDAAEGVVRRFLDQFGFAIHPIGPDETSLAVQAFARYGKGRHPAGLNMGDCFSYACARARGTALLYKGEDFARTDLA